MQQKTAIISFAPASITSTAMIFTTAVQLNAYPSITPNLTQIGTDGK
jgi:hypothetical protein